MGKLYIGDVQINKLRLGDAVPSKIYIGDTIVWSAVRSADNVTKP